MERIKGLDSLRGLLACGVMVYHFMSWAKTSFYNSYHSELEILAVSFVEMFFIISGFSLFYVYRNRLVSTEELKRFFIRRYFRIAPLYYILLLLVIAIKLVAVQFGVDVNRPVDLYLLVTNITFLFGLIWPSDSLLVAGWSIGVEMAMYLLFPLLLVFVRNIYWSVSFCLIAMLSVFYYSFFFLDVTVKLSDQWGEYTFFINHLHFFVSGFFLCFIFEKYQHCNIKKVEIWLLIFSLVAVSSVFLFYSQSVEQALIGSHRYILFFICVGMVALFALGEISNKYSLHLGDLSYSIYLGHFFVFLIVNKMFKSEVIVVMLSSIGTYVLAVFTYTFVEKPMINFGKRFG